MIKYEIICKNNHTFESWFQNYSKCEELIKKKMIMCPHCNESEVKKNLMAPNINTHADKSENNQNQPIVLRTEKEQEYLENIKLITQKMLRNSTEVGNRFYEEALWQSQNNKMKKIHGTASEEQVRDLIEKDIPVLPLPKIIKNLN